MTRFTASRFGALITALIISLGACSDDYSVGPQIGVDPVPTAFIIIPGDPTIVDVLVSECGEFTLPSTFMHVPAWYSELEAYDIELAAGCYDVRVVRETEDGFVTLQQLGIELRAGDVYTFAPDSDA